MASDGKDAATRSEEAGLIDLREVSVVIPVRIDSPDRLRNLELVLSWLEQCFRGHETLVVEYAPRSQAEDSARAHSAQYVFLESNGCFHKSRVFNLGIALAERPYVLLYDCDVLFEPAAIGAALDAARDDSADCVYPYNGVMVQLRCDENDPAAVLDVPGAAGTVAYRGTEGECLGNGIEYLHGTVDDPSTGGALLCNRRRLILFGGFNENIVSYGCEDTELETRVLKLGGRVRRLPGYNCFHIHHRRGQDSHYNNFHAVNLAEWRKVEAMTSNDLARYVRNGFRRLDLDSRRSLTVVDCARQFSMTLDDAGALSLEDTAMVLAIPRDSRLPPALIAAFIDGLEAIYDNYELHLVEQHGNRYRAVSHRDHVLYTSSFDDSACGWLLAAATETDRQWLCLCTPFVDTQKSAFYAAVESLRSGGLRARELFDTAESNERAQRVRGVLAGSLPGGSRSFAFDRRALLDRLAGSGGKAAVASEAIEAAAAALGAKLQ